MLQEWLQKKQITILTFPFGSTNCIRFQGYYLSPQIGTPLKHVVNIGKKSIQKIFRRKRLPTKGLSLNNFCNAFVVCPCPQLKTKTLWRNKCHFFFCRQGLIFFGRTDFIHSLRKVTCGLHAGIHDQQCRTRCAQQKRYKILW